MGKRSDFSRSKNDLYRTCDPRAVEPLMAHLMPGTHFIEPCAGHGDLIGLLQSHGHVCVSASDIEPHNDTINRDDARTITVRADRADCIITNPPWTRELLHPIILNLYHQLPTWLLFDADWAHTMQAAPYLPLCRKIVAVGRVKWIEGSKFQSKDNCCWHLFAPGGSTQFVGRRS